MAWIIFSSSYLRGVDSTPPIDQLMEASESIPLPITFSRSRLASCATGGACWLCQDCHMLSMDHPTQNTSLISTLLGLLYSMCVPLDKNVSSRPGKVMRRTGALIMKYRCQRGLAGRVPVSYPKWVNFGTFMSFFAFLDS
ncbi:hypothetical protein PAXRUDRAFT_829750 [Paxillus rubicundulus Ve08.2h10]|uniref:Uncharacterized protein n=1 Tax=Paxillus rubicundulus Ve08.2h10 TaxID=930991 RepID=A0A0D0DM55_9AGAM|nr:hypothetical protein PAXRUDRAFT_829750 [Paxillus rubicundulus Ve08.2h10]